jgi:hypothetical protein
MVLNSAEKKWPAWGLRAREEEKEEYPFIGPQSAAFY